MNLLKCLTVLLSALFPLLTYGGITIEPGSCVILAEKDFKEAAGELAYHLNLITGKEIPVVSEVQPGQYVIRIGAAPEGPVGYTAAQEGYWKFRADGAWFYGNSPRSVLFTVHDFLENALQVRWPAPGTVCFIRQDPLNFEQTEGKFANSLLRREIRQAGQKRKTVPVWMQRMRMDSGSLTGKVGHAFTQWWAKYGKDHPDYFALNQGQRFPISGIPNYKRGEKKDDITLSQGPVATYIPLCVSNPAVVDQIIRNWNGKKDFLNICENDAPAWISCHCDACRALDADPEGVIDNPMGADRYVDFGNRVLAEARKIRQDAKVYYYAYNASEQPPLKTKIADGSVIGLVPTDFRYEELARYIDGWKKAGLTEFFYRPNYHYYFHSIGFPIGNDDFTFRIHQLMHQAGADGYDYDAPGNGDLFRDRLDYILYHAMLEPEKPFEYWEKHYAQAFGEAEADVTEYFRVWTKIWNERIEKDLEKLTGRKNWYNFSREFYPRVDQYYRDEDFVESGKILDRALTRKMSPEARQFLSEIKLFHDHAALMLKCFRSRKTEDVLALIDFRKKNGMDVLQWYENRYEDPLGVRRALDAAIPSEPTPVLWHFRLDPDNEGVTNQWFLNPDLAQWDGMMPTHSTWEKPKAVDGHPSAELQKKTANYDGFAWYAQKIRIPEKWKGTRILLHFGAVDEGADVWVNGKPAGSHPFVKPDDWKTPFDIDITGLIDWTQVEQLVVVRVSDKTGAGGIWKPVEIRSVENWVPVKTAFSHGKEFERHSPDGVCEGWTKSALAWTDRPQSGKGCMKQRSYGGNWDVVMYGSLFKVEPGEKYKLTVWNRNTLISGTAQFGVRFADEKKETPESGYIFQCVRPGADEWRQYEQDFVIPEQCRFINVYFRVVNPVGDVFWDSLELYRSEPVNS